MARLPSRLLSKTISLPSGDQSGVESDAVLSVSLDTTPEPSGVHREDLGVSSWVGEGWRVGGAHVEQLGAVRRPIEAILDPRLSGNPYCLSRPVGVGDVDIVGVGVGGVYGSVSVTDKGYLGAIRRPSRTKIERRIVGNLSQPRAVGVHNVYVLGVYLLCSPSPDVSIRIGCSRESDLLAIGRRFWLSVSIRVEI